MSTVYMYISVGLSVILGTILFQFINRLFNVMYFGFGRIITVWGTCVIIVFFIIFGISEWLGILDFVTR